MGRLTVVKPPSPPEQWRRPVALVSVPGCDLGTFTCGHPALDNWLQRTARNGEGVNARTYVVLTTAEHVAAYYAIVAGQIMRDSLPSAKLRRNAPELIPVLTLARMGVHLQYQRQGLGSQLLQHAYHQCLAVAEMVGVRALVTQPIDDDARAFYREAGFLPLEGQPPLMFVPIEDMRS